MESLSKTVINAIINFGLSHFEGLEKVHGCDLHHELFNMHYFNNDYDGNIEDFINEVGAFALVGRVVKYEKDMFGDITTDIEDNEKCLNMFVYIIGEELLQKIEILTDNYWNEVMTAKELNDVKEELKSLLIA